MFSAFARAIAQLSDPRFRRALLIGIGGAVLTYLLLGLLLSWVVAEIKLLDIGWAETTIDILGGASVFLLSLLFFPAVVTVVLSVVLDDVVAAVEDKHYPSLPAPRPQPLHETLIETLRFAGVAISLNLLALPLYLLTLFFGFGPLLFYVLNGYLVSREYFELVALRRLPPEQGKALRRMHQGYLWLIGAALTFLLSVPLVNLVAPVIGAAAMVHIFEKLRAREGVRP